MPRRALSPAPPVVVTGATGNVGAPLARALAAAGRRVRLATTDPARARSALGLAGPGVEYARFDFADPGTYAAAFGGAGALFLLRPPQVSDARRLINPAVDAAVAAGVRRVAFLSIQGAERNPVVPHHAIERHLEQLAARTPGLAATFLRAAFFMQNLATTHAADIRERGEVFVPAGGGRTAFVDARDVAGAAARVLAGPSAARVLAGPSAARVLAGPSAAGVRAYELTGREALTYDEVAAVLTRVLGRRVVYARPGVVRFYARMRREGRPRGLVLVMCALYTTARLGLAGHLSPELKGLLGRAPGTFEGFAWDYAGVWG